MKLSELESILGSKFPKKWHEIHDTGAMEWLETGSDNWLENRERYLNDPKAFLILSCDCEPLMFDEIPERLDELNEWISWRGEYDGARLKRGIKLIPFAQRGNGDLYCFLYEGEDEPKIILYCHDFYEDSCLMWKNLDELLYDCMLDAVEPEYGDDVDDEHWQAHLGFLTEEQRTRLIGRSREDIYDEYLCMPEQTENIFESI